MKCVAIAELQVLGNSQATIEDLAIGVHSSREPDEVEKRSGWVIEKIV
jgi:hypothetical protein